jgi:acyl carrier protein
MTDDIESKVRAIICEQLDLNPNEDVSADKAFIDDLDADSLAVVELVLALEDSFGIKIPDEDVENLRTVGDAIAYIRAHKKA